MSFRGRRIDKRIRRERERARATEKIMRVCNENFFLVIFRTERFSIGETLKIFRGRGSTECVNENVAKAEIAVGPVQTAVHRRYNEHDTLWRLALTKTRLSYIPAHPVTQWKGFVTFSNFSTRASKVVIIVTLNLVITNPIRQKRRECCSFVLSVLVPCMMVVSAFYFEETINHFFR